MFWAACCLGYFGLLRASEFTVPNLASFPPSLHLSVQDISVDSMVTPSCTRVNIKGSKTDPFRQGCYVHIGAGHLPLCTLSALMTYLSLRGNSAGPLFLFPDGRPLSRATLLLLHGVNGGYAFHDAHLVYCFRSPQCRTTSMGLSWTAYSVVSPLLASRLALVRLWC